MRTTTNNRNQDNPRVTLVSKWLEGCSVMVILEQKGDFSQFDLGQEFDCIPVGKVRR